MAGLKNIFYENGKLYEHQSRSSIFYGGEDRYYKKGNIICREGDHALYYYQIIKGKLKQNNYKFMNAMALTDAELIRQIRFRSSGSY